jgi:hypothetical protein|tara:strand:+ start:2615 stop:2737 length:123 start_codon:yes stop_codon:yes gene_type:complete
VRSYQLFIRVFKHVLWRVKTEKMLQGLSSLAAFLSEFSTM